MNTTKEDMNNWFGNFPPKTFADGTCHLIGSFGNVGVIETDEGLVVFDLAPRQFHKRIFEALREFSDKPVKYIIYSHGHFDHCFGYASIIKEVKEKGWEMPQVIGHENLLKRWEKYRMLDKYHIWLNSQQFASIGIRQQKEPVSAHETLDPTIVLHGDESFEFKLGGYTFEIYHDIGETDDSLWMFFPEKKVLFTGELVSNPTFPNIGNPNKVQRYPKHWAIAMEKMMEKNAEYILPGHGRLIEGKEDVKEALSIRAEAMHFVHDEVVKRLNQGKWFEQIYHEMMEIYPEKFKNHRFLTPSYGCYRFAIHAAYRLYHGWYNTGNPTDLFPAESDDIAKEFLELNTPKNFLDHSKYLYEQGKLQLSLHILDVIVKGKEKVNNDILIEAYTLKSKILKSMAKKEPSFIAKNSYINGAEQLKLKVKELKNAK
jgi:alkyl sulfatase BDS1-like metallo-beta-lactamase superfamily hydrolase